MSRLSQAIDANRGNITVERGDKKKDNTLMSLPALLRESGVPAAQSGQSRLSQAIDSARRGETVHPQSWQDNESGYTPAPSMPTYGSVQSSMSEAAQSAPLGAAMSAAVGVQMAEAAGPTLAWRKNEIRLETLRRRAEELEAQYREIEQQASRSRYRKYGSERAEAGELWRAARDEYERSAAEMGLAKPTFGERILKTLSGAGKQYLGSTWDAAAALMPNGAGMDEAYQEQLENLYGEKQRTEEWLRQPEDEGERRQLESRLASINEQIAVYEVLANAEKGMNTGARDAAAGITQSGAADLERAKFGAGKLGQLAVDVGAAGAQMAGDAALGAVTGFGSMAPMMVRSFGSGTQQAREKGYSQKQQIALGLSSAATEYFSEKLFGGNPVYDSDAGLVSKLVGKITKNETVLEYLASRPAEMLYEGLEEVTADLLEPLAEQIIAGQHDELTLEQIIDDGIVGIMTAGVMQGGAKLANKGLQGGAKLADTAAQGGQKILNTVVQKIGDAQAGRVDQVPGVGDAAGETGNAAPENKRAIGAANFSTGDADNLLLPEQSESAKGQGLPIRRDGAEYKIVEIPQSKINEIAAYIEKIDSSTARKKYKRILKNLFMGQTFTNVNTVVNELAYEIGISSKGIGEIIARQPVNAETLAMLEQLNEIVENAKYVASEPTSHTERRGIDRTDIFETETMMGDTAGKARLRVNVGKEGNKLYYASNVEKEGGSDQPRAGKNRRRGIDGTTLYEDNITQKGDSVNKKTGAADRSSTSHALDGAQVDISRPAAAPADASIAQNNADVNRPATIQQRYPNTAARAESDGRAAKAEVNENGLVAFSELEKNNLSSGKKNKIVSTFQEAIDFIKNVLTNTQSTDRAYMGKIPEATVRKVMDETGINISGYTAYINGNDVRHILKHHGSEQTEAPRGQVAVTAEDIAQIPSILAEPDSVKISPQLDDKGRKSLIFEKNIGENYVTVQAVSNGKRALETDTLFKQKRKNSQDTGHNAGNKTDPVINAQGEPSLSASFNVTIPQNSGDVNAGAKAKATTEDSFGEIAERILSEEQTKTDTQYEKERLRQEFGDFVGMLAAAANPISDTHDGHSAAERAADKVRTLTEKTRKGTGESIADSYHYIRRKMLDSGEAVQRVAKAVGSKTLYPYYNMARGAGNAAVSMIVDAQTDIRGVKIGKSLNEIMKPIREKGDGYYSAFQQYMLHMHNADRMSRRNEKDILRTQEEFAQFKRQTRELSGYAEYQIEQIANEPMHELNFEASEYMRLLRAMRKAENTENKPVFGYDVTASDSVGVADALLGKYPEFEQMAQEVYSYIDGLNRYRVDSGLISEEEYQTLKEIYPHYVPVFRTMEKKQAGRKANSVEIGKTIGRATGGEASIMPMHEALAKQTYSVVREGSKNRFGQMLLDSKAHTHEKGKKHVYEVTKYEGDFSPDSFDDGNDGPLRENTFVVRKNGKRYEMTVSPALFEGIRALSPDVEETNTILTVTRMANDIFKKLVTGWNPIFTGKNFARDMQDSWIYSKNLKDFGKNYPQALAQIATNGEYWQQYKALGGISSSIFDYETGNVEEHGKLRSITVDKMEALNMAVEQAPRLAEFMATVKKGDGSLDNLMEAMYNAADITVNFGRSGTWGKWLNANLIPFLNPGIQGFDKTIRRFSETRGLKEWAGLTMRCAVLGFAPLIVNTLLYGDDDEWEIIKDRDKDINYLFKMKNGMWLKLPKGRLLSVLNIIADRTTRAMRGEEIDVDEAISTAMSQTMPANPLEENILRAAFDSDLFDPSSPGKTWYGTDIESKRLQGYAPGERYDEKTDEISKFVGKVTGLSPKKINYLLDQYTGVVGDFILPMLTLASERNMFAAGFTLDANYSNKLSGAFYDISDELTYAKNAVNATGEDAAVMRYWNKVNSSVSEINAEIRKIEADEELSAKEKRELTREQYALRNTVQKAAIDSLGEYIDAVEKYYTQSSGDESDRTGYAYRMANRELFGAEYALEVYSKQTYAKAQDLHEQGVSYDVFFDAYFGAKDESNALNGKEPPNYQKWRAAINAVDSAGDALDALKVFMNEEQYAKASFAISNCDISAAAYVTVQEELAGLEKKNQESVAQAINRVAGLTQQERAVLWQLANLAWKSDKNPFDKEAGAQVLRELEG